MIPFFLMLTNEDDHLKNSQSFCPIKMLTGFPCPSCGITKSIVCFYQGDFFGSYSYHVLGPIVVVFSFCVIALLSAELIMKKDYFKEYIYSKKLAYGLAIFLVVYHIVRLIYFIKQHSFYYILKESIWK